MSSPGCPVPSLPWAAPLLRHRVKGQLGSGQGLVNNWAGDKSGSKEEQRERLQVVTLSQMLLRFPLPGQRLLSIAPPQLSAPSRVAKAENPPVTVLKRVTAKWVASCSSHVSSGRFLTALVTFYSPPQHMPCAGLVSSGGCGVPGTLRSQPRTLWVQTLSGRPRVRGARARLLRLAGAVGEARVGQKLRVSLYCCWQLGWGRCWGGVTARKLWERLLQAENPSRRKLI